MPISVLPIAPIPQLAQWSAQLQHIAAQPLAFCQHFPVIARRYEAWWQQDLVDRPIFIGSANRDPGRPITRRLELVDDPDRWHEAKVTDLLQTHRVGDRLPWIRVDFGAVLLGGLYGGRREHLADTSWTHPFIDDDWSNAPDWQQIDEANRWWQRLTALLDRAAAEAPGRYLVCVPDLGGSADVLLTLRGSAQLSLDVLDQPEQVRQAVHGIYQGWRQGFIELYRRVVERGAGLISMFGPWSNQPLGLMACDFNSLIGPRHFQDLFLADIARQAATVGRALYHLDGANAARHIDALLEVPHIQAIQFTPGAGSPSALPWIEMYRKIQARGRSVLAFCMPEDVLPLCEALDPRGLALYIDATMTPRELDDLFAAFCRTYGCTA